MTKSCHRRTKRFSFNNDLPVGTSKRFIDELLQIIGGMEGFAASYLRESILSKYCDSSTTPAAVRKDAAVTKWLAADRRNSITNQRLLFSEDKDFGWASFSQILEKARALIKGVIGAKVPYPEVLNLSVFTNGASTRVNRSPMSSYEKLQGKVHISESAVKHWLAMASSTLLSHQELELREMSTLFTVPKNSEIDRVCCKEPEGNALLQRSIGIYFARRLRRVGIDLRDQTNNQRLAATGVTTRLATIDLSAASDSISTHLVYLLLPFDWWSLLDDLRVKAVEIDGQVYHPDMFSSMGNGFTFELETLIFWALTRSVCYFSGVKGTVSVYGDDIIAPCSIVPRLIRLFHYVGFRVNAKKTFFKGPFRESCGKHYFNGRDVSPFFIRREITTKSDLILLLNELLEWDGRGWGFFTTEALADFHKRWSRLIPPELYGGVEPTDPMALVTGHLPRKRLAPITRSLRFKRKAVKPKSGLKKPSYIVRSGYDEDTSHRLWQLVRDRMGNPFSHDPRIELGFELTSNRNLGAVTSWRPYLIKQIR